MADGATADRIEAIRNVPTLEALYAAGERINMTPGWVRREQPILWTRRIRPSCRRIGAMTNARRRSMPPAGSSTCRSPSGATSCCATRSRATPFATTRTLVCAYQMILPGEAAPSHRHAPHALRVIIEGKGSYSTVDGEKTPMETGDVVLTPGWCWHEPRP